MNVLSLEQPIAAAHNLLDLPSVDTCLSILQTCRKEKNLSLALGLHMRIAANGLDGHRGLGHYLVPLYVDCRSFWTAQQVFNRLTVRNDYCWTSLIEGYIECGEMQHAFTVFRAMQDDHVQPNGYTFVALLKACAGLQCMKTCHAVHAEISKNGYEDDLLVGTALMSMYIKFGLLTKAQEVFDKLQAKDVVTWTALICGYAEYSFGKEALTLFGHMQHESLVPNSATYVSSLKSCGIIGATGKGREIHGNITMKGLEQDLFVGSALVDMYGKCGWLVDAHAVFDELADRDLVLWNALISGYAEAGLGDVALELYEGMQIDELPLSSVTYAACLKACKGIGFLERAQEIHLEIVREGFESDAFVGSALVDMYASFSLLGEAHEVLINLPVRDVVVWTGLIGGYAEHGLGAEALSCLENMQLEGVRPNAVTFVCSLKACGAIRALDRVRELHNNIVREGMDDESLVGNTLVDAYAKCDSLIEAQKVFDLLSVRQTVSLNALMIAYVKHGCCEEALHLLQQMELEGAQPDDATFVCGLKACVGPKAIDRLREIYFEIVVEGAENSLCVSSTLVDAFAKCGLLVEAKEVFDESIVHEVVGWTAYISALVENGQSEEALLCLDKMMLEEVSPDAVTYVCILKACGIAGAIDKGRELHIDIVNKGFEKCSLWAVGDKYESIADAQNHCKLGIRDEVFLLNGLVDMYGKCGSMTDAQHVFDAMSTRDIVTWNALIAGYARHGESKLVFDLLDRMNGEGIALDEVTFLSVLSVCSHTGLVNEGQEQFRAISEQRGMTSKIEHHNCMVDILSRAGQLDEASVMLEKLPCYADLVTWSTMLGACQKWRNLDVGRQAFQLTLVAE